MTKIFPTSTPFTNNYHSNWVCEFNFYVSTYETVQHLFFNVWYISPNIIPFEFIHAVTEIGSFLLVRLLILTCIKDNFLPIMVVHAWKPSIWMRGWEMKLQVWSQPGLQNKTLALNFKKKIPLLHKHCMT